jgi:hypothetical protein
VAVVGGERFDGSRALNLVSVSFTVPPLPGSPPVFW